MERASALERVEAVLDAVESEQMPVPVREVWVYGDVALGLDPVERLDIYLTKDLILRGDADAAAEFEATHGVKGVGRSVSAAWAEANPELLRTNASGHAAPEKCLAAQLVPDDEPIHLEVCNASFEDNVQQRLKGALARDAYEQILDPRGVCLYAEGQRSESALEKLRGGELVFPTLEASLSMLGLDEGTAAEAADAVKDYRASQTGRTVRGDVV
ncbi:hypothetical protein D3D02_04755 [Halobellus sp. Atlit-38R]|uniref:DUF7095 family protein n=1 Tax=Halobellus sp. Atlit-38R TaxID=2282131 RepID=UPI000EF230A6|nr:hypothetical protein [Halobellus sp. Atlit-38R]RLM90095.1 hypothetical protein D3D02_04755 [Halobellus sp. Atlit-38R]